MQLLSAWQPYGNADPLELDRLANRLLLASVLLMAVPLGGSIARSPDTGWLPIFTFQSLLYGSVVLIFLCRKLLDTRIKAAFMVFAFFLVAALGHYALGQLKGGILYLPIAVVIAMFFFSPQVVASMAVVSLVGLFYIARGYISGQATSAIPLEIANSNLAQWINYGFSFFAFFVILGIVMFGYRNLLSAKVSKLESHRDEILHLKNHDQLTGLPSLTLALERLGKAREEAIAEKRQGALMLIRLENFEDVVDSLGYEAGEQILREVSNRLSSLMRSADTLARAGGNRLLVIVPELKSNTRADFLSQMIHEKMAKPFLQGTASVVIHSRIGITLFPDEDLSVEQLLQKANTARFTAEKRNLDTYLLE